MVRDFISFQERRTHFIGEFFFDSDRFFSDSLSKPFAGRTGPNQKIKKIPKGTPCTATLVESVSFTSKDVVSIFTSRDEKKCQRSSKFVKKLS